MCFALVGLGRIGRLHLDNLVNHLEGVHTVAVCDAHGDAVEKTSQALGISGYTDLNRLLDREKPDAVVVATPSSTHSELIRTAAEHRIHVFCEKPMALKVEDARTAAEEIERSGVQCQIGYQRRFDLAYREARKRIQAGEIGDPVTFKAVSRDSWEPPLEFARLDVSGGLFIDMAIHDFDLARWMMGSEVKRVSAMAGRRLYPHLSEVDDYDSAVVNLDFESGATGNVEASRTGVYGYDVRTEIVGTRGCLRVGFNERPGLTLLSEGKSVRATLTGFEERFLDSFQRELQSFVTAIREGRPPECDARDGVQALRIAEAARGSLTGGSVSVREGG